MEKKRLIIGNLVRDIQAGLRDIEIRYNQAFDGVKDTVYSGTDLKDFDFYFDYVVGECEKLKPLWEE